MTDRVGDNKPWGQVRPRPPGESVGDADVSGGVRFSLHAVRRFVGVDHILEALPLLLDGYPHQPPPLPPPPSSSSSLDKAKKAEGAKAGTRKETEEQGGQEEEKQRQEQEQQQQAT